MAALTSTDFTETLNGATFGWSGTQFTISGRPTNALTGAYELSNVGKTTNFIIAQANVAWTNGGTSEDEAGIMIGSAAPTTTFYDTPYSAKICSRSDAGNHYRLMAGAATYNSYGKSDGTVDQGKDVKIVYDTATNHIDFSYWNGSAWAALGTQQTYNIKNSGTVYFYLWYVKITTSVLNVVMNNIYFDSYASDYATQYPGGTASAIKSINGVLKASVAKINGLAIANVKSWGGLA